MHKGKIVAERYATGVTKDTQLESWSMGKSLTATLFALLVKDGTYTIDQPAPVPLWRRPSDPRAPILNRHLLQMSAGLKFVGNQEPGGVVFDPVGRTNLHEVAVAGLQLTAPASRPRRSG